ncbi:MAG: DsrE family protein [Chloroflexota bacterium]|nr:DsrE family protein [Chloroflexota bacterium]
MNRSLAIAVAHDGLAQPSGDDQGCQLECLLHLLLDADTPPTRLLFYTEGVRWVTRNSPLLELLRAVEARGVELVACRTCLKSAGLLDQVAVGKVGSQDGIIEAMHTADNVVVV